MGPRDPQDLGIDRGWLMTAIASASDPAYALVDSGATNALRPAEEGELAGHGSSVWIWLVGHQASCKCQ